MSLGGSEFLTIIKIIIIISILVIIIIIVEVSESSDRLKRERWMDQKAKKIKDQTVRSLESEVQKIMNRWFLNNGNQ